MLCIRCISFCKFNYCFKVGRKSSIQRLGVSLIFPTVNKRYSSSSFVLHCDFSSVVKCFLARLLLAIEFVQFA
jgi:hypothetical protein